MFSTGMDYIRYGATHLFSRREKELNEPLEMEEDLLRSQLALLLDPITL
jgi:hypothetical protein